MECGWWAEGGWVGWEITVRMYEGGSGGNIRGREGEEEGRA